MPRKRRWRTTIQQQSTTPLVETARVQRDMPHAQPTPVPIAEMRHVGLIITLLFIALFGITIAVRSGSNQAILDAYLATLLN